MVVSPYINHFIQPDTIIPNPANPQSWNRYSYVLNNPTRFNDPTGHKFEEDLYETRGKECSQGDTSCNWLSQTKKHRTVDPGVIKRFRGGNNDHGSLYDVSLTSFGMYQIQSPYIYRQAAEESYTDFPGGGDPKYAPQVFGITNRGAALGNPADVMGLVNDALIGIKASQKPPADQYVYLMYEDESIIGLSVYNTSNIDQVINYMAVVTTVDHSLNVQTSGSAAPGQAAQLPLKGILNSSNWGGGFLIRIFATTVCLRQACLSDPNNTIEFHGSTKINFNP